MALFLSLHQAPGLSREEIAGYGPDVAKGVHATFRQLYVNTDTGFVVSVWSSPKSPWVWRGEMQTFGHFTIPPYAIDPSGICPLCTAGSFVSIPMPAGIFTCFPLMKMSRCEWTWYARCSFTSGTSPALRVSAIGSLGAGHGAAPVFGTGAG